jgi:hypothetical protein
VAFETKSIRSRRNGAPGWKHRSDFLVVITASSRTPIVEGGISSAGVGDRNCGKIQADSRDALQYRSMGQTLVNWNSVRRSTGRPEVRMDIRYHFDPETGEPHIFEHNVSEMEVEQAMRGPGEDLPARNGARMKLGRTAGGRYLQVIYVPDQGAESVFVITAYDLSEKAKKAFRRRQRRKPK